MLSSSLPSRNCLHGTLAGVALAAFALSCIPARAQEHRAPEQDVGAEQPAAYRIGDATATALRMQVEGRHAGTALPMLGPTAGLGWQRYLDSYRHPIPETFARNLDQVGNR